MVISYSKCSKLDDMTIDNQSILMINEIPESQIKTPKEFGEFTKNY